MEIMMKLNVYKFFFSDFSIVRVPKISIIGLFQQDLMSKLSATFHMSGLTSILTMPAW